ncbi:MAG: hypothetical protein JO024_05005 [Candidatus Eremiobacteraeota bacterium]|nr:hypothetical protein [Candidatus Eremiobacteraeota bacterium]MBV9737574.1 hypothetical protein [Candidatus Eremiobacteraeota bacterium]
MPRLIIDTESSRPAYRRRIAVRVIVAVVVLVALALLTYAVVTHGVRI